MVEIENDMEIPDELGGKGCKNTMISMLDRFRVEKGKPRKLLQSESFSPKKSDIALDVQEKDTNSENVKKRKSEIIVSKCLMKSESKRKTERIKQLTKHITTRWYRAPEVILLEDDYGPEVDLWGAGCVFAELMQMFKGNEYHPKTRCPLFPGNSCYPVSPIIPFADTITQYGINRGDQINMIFKILGNPSEEDLKFLSSNDAKYYVNLAEEYQGIDFSREFPASSSDSLELLKKMLAFNPHCRISAKDAIESAYFDEVRSKKLENFKDSKIITLDAEMTEDYVVKLKTYFS
jgi:serine/threonine protein kinase